jgi:cyclase
MHRHHSLPRSLLLCLAAAAGAASPLTADSSQTSERTITKLADGVYEIRHADPLPGWVSGNTLVVIGTRSVFVVDSCFVAWEAKADIAQIRKWTSLPVRYLLNTHWHHDHNAGNGAYLEAFPGADIVATNETKRRLEANSSSNATLIRASIEHTGKQLANELESGKEADGQPLSEERKTRARRTLAQVDKVMADARAWVNQSPTLTFDDQLTIDLGGREVLIAFMGRGNTGGDAIAYLPKEKILATGDLVVHPVPFTFDGYPKEWIRTLERLSTLGAQTIVPGHGEVMHDSRFILQLRDLFNMIVERVETALDRNLVVSLEDVKKMVDLSAQRAEILGDDKEDSAAFQQAMDSFVELAYREAKQR